VRDTGFTTEWIMPYTSFYGAESACQYTPNTSVVTVEGYYKAETNSYSDVLQAITLDGPLAVNVRVKRKYLQLLELTLG
jgi:hypothetical protein